VNEDADTLPTICNAFIPSSTLLPIITLLVVELIANAVAVVVVNKAANPPLGELTCSDAEGFNWLIPR
jgi:hypothetical protein